MPPESGIQHPKLRKVFKESILTLGTTGLILLIRLAKNIIISRILGSTLRGIFAIVILIPEMSVSLGNMGFGTALFYYSAKEKVNLREIIWTFLTFTALTAPIIFIITYGLLYFGFLYKNYRQEIMNYSTLIFFAIPVILSNSTLYPIVISKALIKRYNIIRLIESSLPLILFIFLLFILKNKLDAAVYSWFWGGIIVILLLLLAVRNVKGFPPKKSPALFKKCIKYGIMSHPSNFLQMALLRIDFFFISSMLGARELGYYAIASSIAELLLTIPHAIVTPFMPTLLGMNDTDASHFTPQIVRLTLPIIVILNIMIIILGKPFIRIFFSSEYLPAFPALAWLTPGIIALSIHPFLRIDLFSRHMPGTVSLLTSVALIINLILNWITIPLWGIRGAAISSSIGYLVCTSLLFLVYCRKSSNSLKYILLVQKTDIQLFIAHIKKKIYENDK